MRGWPFLRFFLGLAGGLTNWPDMIWTQPGDANAVAGVRRTDEWFTPWRFAGLLGLLIVACFPHVVAGWETFFYRDYAAFGYPLAYFHKESFWHGEMPLWNPFNDCGLPFTAQWNTMSLYPLSLFYLLLPLSWSLGVFCLGHVFLAGMGMYFLAHRWTGSRLAAAVAGVAFAYNGLTWHSLMWPNNISALGWMPWVVLAAELAWRRGGRWVIGAALVGATQMLAGAPEVILQTWALLGMLWLVILLRREVGLAQMIGRGLCVGVVVGGLAAAQLMPFLDMLTHSQRDAGFGDSRWAMPGSGWGNYLVPLFHCTPVGQGVYMQHEQYWTSSYFVGVGIVALALLAVWRVRQWRVWLLAAVALFSLTMALGDNGFVYAALRKVVPQIGFMRFPIKFVVLATFVIPLLAAHGVSWLEGLSAESWPKEWKRLKILGGVLSGLIAVILCVAKWYPQDSDNISMTMVSGARGAVFLALILGCVAMLRARTEVRAQRLLQTGLIVMLWFDVFTHAPNLSPTIPRWVYEPGLMRTYLKWDAQLRLGESRAMQSHDSLVKLHSNAVGKPVDDFNGRRMTLFDNLNLLDQVPKLDGFYSLYFHQMSEIIIRLYSSTNDAPGLMDFLGISHVNKPGKELEWLRRDTVSPLVTAGQQPVLMDDAGTLNKLFEPTFDGRKTVYLPLQAEREISAGKHGDAKIGAVVFAARRLSFPVEATGTAMVVVAQAYYHPWHAYVDGKLVPLERANYAFQALEVPTGAHRVELVYEDKKFHQGGVISLATLLGCAAGWIIRRKPRAKNEAKT
ncbi:MAG: hypothetical protein JWR26_2570 [Pedosphaera sp.]|nr:hypothetical protein [Pedosphaera sp.]